MQTLDVVGKLAAVFEYLQAQRSALFGDVATTADSGLFDQAIRRDRENAFGNSNVVSLAPAPPTISITRTRRVSVSSPLRFTRTFSEDSLDSIEKNGLKELRRQRIMETDEKEKRTKRCLTPTMAVTTSTCPHLGEMGRSRTETRDSDLRLNCSGGSQRSKRSTGDLASTPPSPSSTRKPLNEIIGLTPYQQKLLVQSWPNIFSTGPNGQFASSLYTALCNKNAKARQLLAKANGVAVFSNNEVDCTAMHAKATVELLDSVVRGLDGDHNRLTNYIVEIGRAHRPLKSEGLSIGVWDDLGDAIMDCARKFEAVRKHKELRRAWLAVIAYIMDNLKQGQTMTRAVSNFEISTDNSQRIAPPKKNSFNLSP